MFFFNVCRTIKIQLIQLNTVNLLNFYEQIPNLKMSDYLFCVTSSWISWEALVARDQENGEDGEESSRTKPNLMDSLSQNNV